MYGWNDVRWLNDKQDGGQNNILGKGKMHDGYYWFEFCKQLNSGDGHDWSFVPGGTYGGGAGAGDMLVELWDHSAQTAYNRYVFLTLASSP
jgi:hypothetical protein